MQTAQSSGQHVGRRRRGQNQNGGNTQKGFDQQDRKGDRPAGQSQSARDFNRNLVQKQVGGAGKTDKRKRHRRPAEQQTERKTRGSSRYGRPGKGKTTAGRLARKPERKQRQ